MSEKNRQKLELVYDPKDVPEDLSDEEQIRYWETHEPTEEFLDKVEEAPEDERPRPRERTRPINVRFDEFTLSRLKALAERRNVGYQTLLKEFVAERLYEEEKREGILPAGASGIVRAQPDAAGKQGASKKRDRQSEAAQKFSEALAESYQAVADRTHSAQEPIAELAQNFFDSVINNLQAQLEENQEQIQQQLADQQRRQQEATQAPAQESVNAYMDFINSMFSFWQGGNVKQTQRQATDPGRQVYP